MHTVITDVDTETAVMLLLEKISGFHSGLSSYCRAVPVVVFGSMIDMAEIMYVLRLYEPAGRMLSNTFKVDECIFELIDGDRPELLCGYVYQVAWIAKFSSMPPVTEYLHDRIKR